MLWSAPAWLLVLLLAAKLLGMTAAASSGQEAYRRGDYAAAGSAYDQTMVVNVVEPWVAPYNRGTTAYQQRRLQQARADLTESLRLVPKAHDCRVRLNLVATHEAIGDDLAATGQHDASAQAYASALQVLRAGQCGDPRLRPTPSASPTPGASGKPTPGASGQPTQQPSSQPSEPQDEQQRREEEARRAEQADQRLEGKKREQEGQGQRASHRPSYTPSPEPEPDQPADQSAQQTEMQKKEQEARRERQRDNDRGDTRPGVKRPW